MFSCSYCNLQVTQRTCSAKVIFSLKDFKVYVTPAFVYHLAQPMDPASVYNLLALSVFELLAYISICSQGVGIIPQPKQTT
jgi:hypothetical protein